MSDAGLFFTISLAWNVAGAIAGMIDYGKTSSVAFAIGIAGWIVALVSALKEGGE